MQYLLISLTFLLLNLNVIHAQTLLECSNSKTGAKIDFVSQDGDLINLRVYWDEGSTFSGAALDITNGECVSCPRVGGIGRPHGTQKEYQLRQLNPDQPVTISWAHDGYCGNGEATIPNSQAAKFRVFGAAGQGNSIYLTEHLNFRTPSALSSDDVWEVIPVENGDVVFKCPTRGYLLAGIKSDGGYLVGYHQFQATASRFTPVTAHRGSNEGYTSYRWKNNGSFYLGIWRDLLRLRSSAGDATSWKQE